MRVGRRAAPHSPNERATRAPLSGRAVSADCPRTTSMPSLSFIEGRVLSVCTLEALRARSTVDIRTLPSVYPRARRSLHFVPNWLLYRELVRTRSV
jgi:hypothetical protein